MIQSTTDVVTISPSPRFKDGLRLVFKRYVAKDHNDHGVTLLFFHCTGSRAFIHAKSHVIYSADIGIGR